jgi:nicotinamide-nucleotide amidase
VDLAYNLLMPSAEIIAIGTELLLGETVDTNTRLIARLLRSLGVDLYRTHAVGDNAVRIAQSIRESLARADIVITTGGLGPTVDDPTRQAVAQSLGLELEFHPELWDQVVARISRYGRTPTENQKRQAYIPHGAIVIENPVGTAPAFMVEIPEDRVLPAPGFLESAPGQERAQNGSVQVSGATQRSSGRADEGLSPNPENVHAKRTVISLPGVPREMETLLENTVIPYLQVRYQLNEIIKIRTLHVSGLGEGVIDDLVGDLETQANPTVGLTAHSGVVDIRIAAKAPTDTEAGRIIVKVERDLRSRLGENVFGTDDDTLEGVTLDTVTARGWILATVENGLDGGLMHRLDQVGHPNYRGGSISAVPPEPLPQYAARVMQESAATALLGVVLSESPAGLDVHMLLITPEGQEERRLTYGGHPKNAARWAINNSLDWLRRSALKID